MCMGGGSPGDGGAAAREAARQARITENTNLVNSTFNNTYNDDYYNKASQDYIGYYSPQLEDQYSSAARQLKLINAQKGTMSSSIGAKSMGDLQSAYSKNLADITAKAGSFSNDVRSSVENSRNQLLNQAQGGSSMDQSAILAAAQAAGQAQPTGLLGDVFSGAIQNAGAGLSAYNLANQINTNRQLYNSLNSDSGRVVR